MSKINYRRIKTWKPRIKLPPNRIIDPETLYNRDKEKQRVKREIEKYKRGNYGDKGS